MSGPLHYRTGSRSDLAVTVLLNQHVLTLWLYYNAQDQFENKTQFESVATARSLPLPVL